MSGERYPHLNRFALLRRRSGQLGPWTQTYTPYDYPGYENDHVRNETVGLRELSVSEPVPQSSLVTDRLFFKISDVQFHLLGQTHNFDLFTTRKRLDLKTRSWHGSYYANIHRLKLAHAWKGHQDSGEALTVLHNLARKGGKIAFVDANGGTKDGKWHIYSDEESAPIDEIIRDLASRKNEYGQQEYQAIYFAACNRDGFSPDMNGIHIPIIANRAINDAYAEGNIKVYFPSH